MGGESPTTGAEADNGKRKEAAVPPSEEEEPAVKRVKTNEEEEEDAALAAASEVVMEPEQQEEQQEELSLTPKEEEEGKDDDPPPKKSSKKRSSTPKTPKRPDDLENFDRYLFQLLLYKADNNNYHVTRDENADLHAWLQHLKREYKHYAAQQEAEEEGKAIPTPGSSLSVDQFKVLQSLHVPLTSRGDDHWNRFSQLLTEYKERHGHVLVPRLCEIPGLGDWVTDQRRQHKAWKQGQPSQLTKERRDKLSALGFVWQVRNRPEWDQRYSELLIYKEKNGDCKVPQHFKQNKALGKWVAKQREQYKLLKKGVHSFLTPYRLERLNVAGFVWQVRTALEGEVMEGDDDGDTPANSNIKEDDDDDGDEKKEAPVTPPPSLATSPPPSTTADEQLKEAADDDKVPEEAADDDKVAAADETTAVKPSPAKTAEI
jgi:hypothetical protein